MSIYSATSDIVERLMRSPEEDSDSRASMLDAAVLGGILVAAAAARLWFLNAGVPHAVGIDEPIVVDHALRILHTGDWNPHVFNYPALVIYFHAGIEILRFLWGALRGEWSSLDAFDIFAAYQAARFATAMIGVATVWFTYRLGVELAGRRVALLAAALMAIRPMHVRESHYALTDVPMTALVTLAMWLTLRAARRVTIRDFAWAGAVCGLAASAKYTGGVAFVGVLVAWAAFAWRSARRGRLLAGAVAAAALAFLATSPYTWLDLPAFLDGFASLFSQYSVPTAAADPVWKVYAKHLWLDGPMTLIAAMLGAVVVLAHRDDRRRWAPVLAVGLLHFYELSTHSHIFGRYALPLLPILCLLASAAVFELRTIAARVPVLATRRAQRLLLAAAAVALAAGPLAATVRWLDQVKRPDTRGIAVAWLRSSATKGSRVAVENSGPTYVAAAGFAVIRTELLFEHDVAWYRQHADYLVVSSPDVSRYADLLAAGPTVFQIAPTPQRWGPPILIVSIAPAAR
jgi:4-amino-4-deoxy-L-arabinose transferase-like glycosyltransferase